MTPEDTKASIFFLSEKFKSLFTPAGKPIYEDEGYMYDNLVEQALLLIFHFCKKNTVAIDGYSVQQLSNPNNIENNFFWWDEVGELQRKIAAKTLTAPKIVLALFEYLDSCFYN